jgi:diguanylate cyclase (GGDEF)-like protein
MLKTFLQKISFSALLEKILQRPWIVIFGITAITILFAFQIPQLSFKTSIYDLVIEDLPANHRYDAFKNLFGSDEIIRVVVKSENIFDPATFKKIEELSKTAAKIKGVRRIISLPGIRKSVDISGEKSLKKFADILDAVSLFQKNLFSTDHKSTAITLVLAQEADTEQVIEDVNQMIADASKNLSLYQIGMPLVSQALARLTEEDFIQLPPITFLLIAFVLLCLYRNFLHLALPLVCVIFALTWTLGFMALTQIPLSMLTLIVPVFLIAVGTAYCLHIISEYLTQVKVAESSKAAANATFATATFPTTLAVATTAIGLGSLLINKITTIREFAVFSCLGLFSLLIVLLTFLPAAMAIMPLRKNRKRIKKAGFLDRLLAWVVRLDLHHQRITLPILGIITLVCLIGIFQIRVETNPVDYFKEDIPVSRNFHDIYQDLSGSFPLNVSMQGDQEGYFEDPKHIADIAKLQKFIDTLPGVDKTISFADYLQLVNYASNSYDPTYYTLPTDGFEIRMLINSYRMMLGEDMLNRFMKSDFSHTNIMLLTHISSSQVFLQTRARILDYVEKNFSKDLVWDVTGFGMVISESSHQLTSGQVKSLAITMVLVFGIMFLLFLSSKVGFIAIVPNLFPIIINFGIMGWFGVELSMVTSLIASIAIGLAVDDTIHYLVRYNREFREDLDEKRALRETIMHMGRPIIATTLSISIGFSILTLSGFKPTAIFGVMMMITMFSALVADLILLPSLMLHFELVTLWDLVRLKLGMNPEKGIQLFKGLSRTQVHYIVMAGSLKKFEAGQVVFYQGDQSDIMYVVISGELNVVEYSQDKIRAQAHDIQKLITKLHIGDSVGEMGLMRNAPRSATVMASKESELLQVNWKMIQRLQWLYPPTAQKFLFNLMIRMCDRLEDVTDCFTSESLVDDLTGLYNKKGFMKILTVETNRALRYEEDITLCLMNVDFTDTITTSDYMAMDEVLKLIGRTLAREIRRCDTLCRLETQTFALLITQAKDQKARTVWSRLERLLKERLAGITDIDITLSFTTIKLLHDRDKNAADLMNRAIKVLRQTRGE